MKPHESWWERNLDTRMGDFGEWLTQSDASSRDFLYNFVSASPRMRTVLECGPGLFIDWDRFFSVDAVQRQTQYRALDVTPRLVQLGRQKGVKVDEGSIEAIPYNDGAFDLVYCRHVLEHLPTYKTAITEMMRVANDAVICIFWKMDTEGPTDHIEYNTVEDVPNVYHNTYSQKAITDWVAATFNVTGMGWTGDRDRILVIYK